MEGSVVPEDLGAPESWEVADLDESMKQLMLKDSVNESKSMSKQPSLQEFPARLIDSPLSSDSGLGGGYKTFLEDDVNQVDQFLQEALQNPRERLSVLRLELDIERFMRNPIQQQMEFQQLPTSYLRLAAHRVAQHYSLQSMVLLDSNFPDGSNSRIVVRKTAESRFPDIRLADIPVNMPSDGSGVMKVAIKQRPQKQSLSNKNSDTNSSKGNSQKSVEERKEEYNRARARIFNSSSVVGVGSGKSDFETRLLDNPQAIALCIPKADERVVDNSSNRGLTESSTSSSKLARNRAEKEPIGRYKPNSRVAIFRDREVDRKDPDYDRNYDRYVQRFDPGFGFNGGPYTMKPLYAPALNYNTEFPQLGSTIRPQAAAEHQPRSLQQHLPGPWPTLPAQAGVGYGHPESMVSPFSPGQAGAHSVSAMYVHSQHPAMPFMHAHDHIQPFTQSHQQQSDSTFGLARPR